MKFPSVRLCGNINAARGMIRPRSVPFLFGAATAEGYSPMEARELTVWALAIPKKERSRFFPAVTKRKYTKTTKIAIPTSKKTPTVASVPTEDILPTLDAIGMSGWKSTRVVDANRFVSSLTLEQRQRAASVARSELKRLEYRCRRLRWALKRLAANEMENESSYRGGADINQETASMEKTESLDTKEETGYETAFDRYNAVLNE